MPGRWGFWGVIDKAETCILITETQKWLFQFFYQSLLNIILKLVNIAPCSCYWWQEWKWVKTLKENMAHLFKVLNLCEMKITQKFVWFVSPQNSFLSSHPFCWTGTNRIDHINRMRVHGFHLITKLNKAQRLFHCKSAVQLYNYVLLKPIDKW